MQGTEEVVWLSFCAGWADASIPRSRLEMEVCRVHLHYSGSCGDSPLVEALGNEGPEGLFPQISGQAGFLYLRWVSPTGSVFLGQTNIISWVGEQRPMVG